MTTIKIDDIHPGTVLIADGGFTCLRCGDTRSVERDDKGEPYIRCDNGRHYLDGQEDDDGNLIGLVLDPVSAQ